MSPLVSPKIQQWALTLSNYQYRLRYKPGTQNSNADGLNRRPLAKKTLPVPVLGKQFFSLSSVNETPVNASIIAQLITRDPVLSKVVNFVKTGWPHDVDNEFAPCMRRKRELSVEQGCLLRGSRVVIPAPGRETLLDELHECHPGIVRMKASARSFVWRPGLNAEIEVNVRSCVVCEFSKLPPNQTCTHGNGQLNRGIVYTLIILVH